MKKSMVLLVAVGMALGGMVSRAAVIDEWDMNDNGTWQNSNNGLNLGGHYSSNNQQVVQVPDDGTFFFSPLDASGFGPKSSLSSTADLTSGVVRLSWIYTAMDWTNNPAANTQVGFRIWNAAKTEYIALAFVDVADKIFAFAKSSAGLGNLNKKTGRVVNSLLTNSAPTTVMIDLDYANGEIRVSADAWQWNNGFDVHTNAVDFAAAGMTDIGVFQTYYQNWSAGDITTMDNIRIETILDGPPPVVETLDEFTWAGGADGAAMNSVASTTGTGNKLGSADTVLAFVTNETVQLNGTLELNKGIFSNSTFGDYMGSSNGQFNLEWDVLSADFTLTAAFVSNQTALAGFGLRDDTAGNKDLKTLLRFDQTGFVLMITDEGGVTNVVVEDAVTVLSDTLHIRQNMNLDTGVFTVYTTSGAGAEQEAYVGSIWAGFQVKTIRTQVQMTNGGHNWQPGDTMVIDNVVVSRINTAGNPTAAYEVWLDGYPALGAATNLTDDADGDALDNLGEYAFGGDPTDPADQGNSPVSAQVSAGGTNYLEHVYFERDDAADRGLASILNAGTSLAVPNWSVAGIEPVGSGASAVPGFNAVTNRIPTDVEGLQYLRLQVEFTP